MEDWPDAWPKCRTRFRADSRPCYPGLYVGIGRILLQSRIRRIHISNGGYRLEYFWTTQQTTPRQSLSNSICHFVREWALTIPHEGWGASILDQIGINQYYRHTTIGEKWTPLSLLRYKGYPLIFSNICSAGIAGIVEKKRVFGTPTKRLDSKFRKPLAIRMFPFRSVELIPYANTIIFS